MGRKLLFATVIAVAGVATVGSSAANAPRHGTEQFEEWYDASGSLNGYRHWTCSGSVETWGSWQGQLVVTRRACP